MRPADAHRRLRSWLTVALLAAPAAAPAQRVDDVANANVRGAVDANVSYPYSFAVLGHIRGGDDGAVNYLLADVIREVRARQPDFVVLTGDIIWGEVQTVPTDPAVVHAQWDAVDSALATLGVPVYRVPGNHDINDRVTRRVYEERYGPSNRMLDLGDARLLLYTSGFLPDSGDDRKNVYIRGVTPDSGRIAWIRAALDDAPGEPVFMFMHHLPWWEEQNAPWWQEVHPLLATAGVRAVFSGDYGPLKFSHLARDGIDYYQAGLTPGPANLDLLRNHEWNRLLAGQFDNFLFVDVVAPDSTAVTVHTVGETASGDFTPDFFRQVHGGIDRPPPPGGRERLTALWQNPRGRLFLIALPLAGMVAGLVIGGAVMVLRAR